MKSEIKFSEMEINFKNGLVDLFNEISTTDLKTRPLDCYSKAIRLAKDCYGDFFDNPAVKDDIHHMIHTYLAFVQTCILLDLRNDLLRSKKK